MNIRVIPLKNHNNSLKSYSYLIIDEIGRKALLVDPSGSLEKIQQILVQYKVSLSTILITHSHLDHIELVDVLTKKYDAFVMISQIEAHYYRFYCRNLILLENSVPVPFGDEHIVPILTAGHTKGSLCFLIGNCLFSGDTVFIEGCGNCWGEGANPDDMFDSLQFLKKNIPLDTKIYPGHSYGENPGQPFKYLLKNNIYLQFNCRSHFISFLMRKKTSTSSNLKMGERGAFQG